MIVRRWAWLIGMTDETDAQLRDRAKSFATPPTSSCAGQSQTSPATSSSGGRSAWRPPSRDVQITIKPTTPCVNPVFEFARAPRGLIKVKLARRAARGPGILPGTAARSGLIARSAHPPCSKSTSVAPARYLR